MTLLFIVVLCVSYYTMTIMYLSPGAVSLSFLSPIYTSGATVDAIFTSFGSRKFVKFFFGMIHSPCSSRFS